MIENTSTIDLEVIADNLETISDRLVRAAELTADDATRDELHRIVADLESIIERVEETEDAIEDIAAELFNERLAEAVEQQKQR